jgi:hypothetical protein
MNILITEDEIKNNPNYYELGKLVSRKYWEVKGSEDSKNLIMSEDNYDMCIICGEKTPYRYSQDISSRIGYVEGAGQGCYNPIKCNKQI